MSAPTPPPGWYPAPHANGQQRYWDGAQWLEPAPQPAASETPTVAFQTETPTVAFQTETPTLALPAESSPLASVDSPQQPVVAARNSKSKAWIIGGSIAAGVILIGGIGSAIGAGNGNAPSADTKPTTAAVQPATEEEPEPVIVTVPDVTGMTVQDAIVAISTAGLTAPAVSDFEDVQAKVLTTSPAAGATVEELSSVTFTVEEKPKLTLSQENAIGKAKSYLSLMGFSRTGLIQQLEFEGFSTEDATFGTDSAGADWNAECAEKAKSYIDMMSFSRQGLYDQLAFEGFQPAEIEFGLTAIGY